MNRRGFLSGLGSLVAAPAIVPFASLMPIRGIIMDVPKAFDVFIEENYDAFNSFLVNSTSIEQVGDDFYVRLVDKSVYGPFPPRVRVL